MEYLVAVARPFTASQSWRACGHCWITVPRILSDVELLCDCYTAQVLVIWAGREVQWCIDDVGRICQDHGASNHCWITVP